MNIGFDLDKIFISSPRFLPEKLVEMLYRKTANYNKLEYRIPPLFEQKIRIISHHSFFSPPLRKNISYVIKLSQQKKHRLHLISSRFNFLKNQTKKIISKYNLEQSFHTMVFNFENEQPHIFKLNVIKKLNIEKFIDDDLPLLEFLAEKNNKTFFYWFNKNTDLKIKKNLLAITSLEGIL